MPSEIASAPSMTRRRWGARFGEKICQRRAEERLDSRADLGRWRRLMHKACVLSGSLLDAPVAALMTRELLPTPDSPWATTACLRRHRQQRGLLHRFGPGGRLDCRPRTRFHPHRPNRLLVQEFEEAPSLLVATVRDVEDVMCMRRRRWVDRSGLRWVFIGQTRRADRATARHRKVLPASDRYQSIRHRNPVRLIRCFESGHQHREPRAVPRSAAGRSRCQDRRHQDRSVRA